MVYRLRTSAKRSTACQRLSSVSTVPTALVLLALLVYRRSSTTDYAVSSDRVLPTHCFPSFGPVASFFAFASQPVPSPDARPRRHTSAHAAAPSAPSPPPSPSSHSLRRRLAPALAVTRQRTPQHLRPRRHPRRHRLRLLHHVAGKWLLSFLACTLVNLTDRPSGGIPLSLSGFDSFVAMRAAIVTGARLRVSQLRACFETPQLAMQPAVRPVPLQSASSQPAPSHATQALAPTAQPQALTSICVGPAAIQSSLLPSRGLSSRRVSALASAHSAACSSSQSSGWFIGGCNRTDSSDNTGSPSLMARALPAAHSARLCLPPNAGAARQPQSCRIPLVFDPGGCL